MSYQDDVSYQDDRPEGKLKKQVRVAIGVGALVPVALAQAPAAA